MSTPNQSPAEALRHLMVGYRLSQALQVVAELGIAHLLKGRLAGARDV